MPRIRACGSRTAAYDDFKTAVKMAHEDDFPILLVDSEDPVQEGTAWQHLMVRDNWVKPNGASDDQAQLMVQCMETWCVADRQALREFFGKCLHEKQLPPPNGLEARAKDDIQTQLADATRHCAPGRGYSKGKRSFELLGQLRASELKQHLPHFVHLCKTLDGKL